MKSRVSDIAFAVLKYTRFLYIYVYTLNRVNDGRAIRVAIYLRVSTTNQTTDNQRRELEAVASRHSWTMVRVFEDSGISGAKGRDARAGLDALMKGVSRRDFDMVLAWSVDRLGRSLTGLLELLTDSMPSTSTSICTNRASTRPPRRARPCSR